MQAAARMGHSVIHVDHVFLDMSHDREAIAIPSTPRPDPTLHIVGRPPEIPPVPVPISPPTPIIAAVLLSLPLADP